MYRLYNEPDALPARTDFALRAITGCWRSVEGGPQVRVVRNSARKNGGFRVELIYKNPRTVFSAPVKRICGIHRIDLYGRIDLYYDAEKDRLLLSAYGWYVREQ